MKLLLFSEGKSELGGALEALVRRLLPDISCHCEVRNVRDADLTDVHVVGPWKGGGKKLFKRAIRCAILAQRHGYDAAILVIDQDGDKFKHRRDDLDEAQAHVQVTRLKRAYGVAIQSFDAWMLADEVALTRTLKFQVQRMPDPETIPDAKSVCNELCTKAGWVRGMAEFYATLANSVDLGVLEGRCIKGFGQFAQRVRGLR